MKCCSCFDTPYIFNPNGLPKSRRHLAVNRYLCPVLYDAVGFPMGPIGSCGFPAVDCGVPH